ncbi:MAG: hypothetical protein DBX49_06630 [Clostridia bacterium]|nr:MAG: hypothetical protein DBX49_06630 [Clostridia bacterium]
MLEAAFIFIAPGADPERDRGIVETPSVRLHSIGVASYEQGAEAAREMAEAGCEAIELCGGFGIRGTYLVAQAVARKARVGAVRFDLHPGLDCKSGDELF